MNKTILAKIRKCLALAQSSNANEASAALTAAQALMAKYGVSEFDAMLSDIKEMEVTTGRSTRPPAWLYSLIQLVADAFGVHPVYTHTSGGSANLVTFIGPDSAAEIAGYAFTVLRRQVTRARQEYLQALRGRRSTKTRKADVFAVAWVHAVRKKVHAFAGKHDPRIDDYIKKEYPDLNEMKAKKLQFSDADVAPLTAGFYAGSKVTIHQGVNGFERRSIGHAA